MSDPVSKIVTAIRPYCYVDSKEASWVVVATKKSDSNATSDGNTGRGELEWGKGVQNGETQRIYIPGAMFRLHVLF